MTSVRFGRTATYTFPALRYYLSEKVYTHMIYLLADRVAENSSLVTTYYEDGYRNLAISYWIRL